MNISFSRKI